MSQSNRVHFKIALPADLKKRLEHNAVENRRSLSAEIISRLETTLEMDDYVPVSNIHIGDKTDLSAIRRDLAALLQRLDGIKND